MFGLLCTLFVFVCFSMLCMKLAKLLRQTVKFVANEESVTDADSSVCPLAPFGSSLWSNKISHCKYIYVHQLLRSINYSQERFEREGCRTRQCTTRITRSENVIKIYRIKNVKVNYFSFTQTLTQLQFQI